ncbi:MAG: TonB-dependent receptor [Gammaproteobacteria bacterium]|nr:TonB-dependent receptor [Gammaproteobacteria bacterium]
MNKHAIRSVHCLVLALSLSTSTPLFAAAAEPQLSELAGEDYFFAQVPVVLSATRLAQPQFEAPAAVTVIDRTMIEASGALDIPDLLRLVPGFQVGHAKGHTAAATYHGLADEHARRMQVLVDGRPVYGPALGGVRWTDLPLDIKDIDRIEVVRGPNAAAYGSNSFLGAINIITQHPSQMDGTEVSLAGGNKDFRKGLLRHGNRLDKLDYRMTLGYRRDDGFESRTDIAPPDPASGLVSARDPLNDGMRVSLFNFRGEYQLTNTDSVELLAGYNGGPRSEGRFDGIVEAPRNREVQSHFEQLVWRRSHSADEETRVQFYHTYMRHRERTEALLSDIASDALGMPVPPIAIGLFFPGQTDELTVTDYSVFEERYDIEFQNNFRLSPQARMVWGTGARFDRVGGDGWYSRDDYIENQLYRLFGNLEWHPYQNGTLNLGTMLEQSGQIGFQVSPRIALNHQLHKNHGLRLGVSRAYRLPTIYEDNADGAIRFQDGELIDQYILGNTDLDPERITSYELGYLGRFPSINTTLDIKIFHDKLDDRIAAPKKYPYPSELNVVSDGRIFYHTNSGQLSTNGVEIALNYRPEKRTMLGLNWAYAKAKGTALDSFQDSLSPADWQYEDLSEDVPRHTYSAFAMHRLPGQVDVSALYNKVSRMKWLGNGDRLGPQDRLDLRVAKHMLTNGMRSSIALVVQNVLDEYLEFRDENVFDTRAYVELTIGLP